MRGEISVGFGACFVHAFFGANGLDGGTIIQFEDVPNYQDGGVVYTLDNVPVSFPITRQMLGGKKLYIDGGKGAPKFRTTVSGLVLKKI